MDHPFNWFNMCCSKFYWSPIPRNSSPQQWQKDRRTELRLRDMQLKSLRWHTWPTSHVISSTVSPSNSQHSHRKRLAMLFFFIFVLNIVQMYFIIWSYKQKSIIVLRKICLRTKSIFYLNCCQSLFSLLSKCACPSSTKHRIRAFFN